MEKITYKDCLDFINELKKQYKLGTKDRHICNRIAGILISFDEGLITEDGKVIVKGKIVGERG